MEEVQPDLILLDVMMPEVDGFTVCQKLRENVRTTFIPIIMLTANPDEENRTKGFLVGTDDYMNKPFPVCPAGYPARSCGRRNAPGDRSHRLRLPPPYQPAHI